MFTFWRPCMALLMVKVTNQTMLGAAFLMMVQVFKEVSELWYAAK
jgi:hypothetical protein